jgi:hypothetical protein
MPWFKMDDRLHSHPKWLTCSMGARGLWATAGSWCAGNSHDGVVPRMALRLLGGTRRQVAELVDAGLWEPHPDGWAFHDWAHYQPTTEQVEADRAAARERQRRARDKAASRRDNGVTHGAHHGVTHGSVTVPPTRPDPTPLLDPSLGVTSSPPGEPPDSEGVDYEHHPPARIPEDARRSHLAVIAELKRTPEDAA